ncbi:MAG: tRNA epoxyqueuosine(34) reductase QueG [Cellvibrionaceae bacterium]|nr:tRNA epoxyqueuosine(34) reductase QueG [Cellvibrionaceae bacterium]
MTNSSTPNPYRQLSQSIKQWGSALGFQQVGIASADPKEHRQYLAQWLEKGYHGEMEWMRRHQAQRNKPSDLVPEACRVISLRMDYLPASTAQVATLKNADKAYISRYALGRDYHKVVRKRIAQLGKKIEDYCAAHEIYAQATEHAQTHSIKHAIKQRPFVDSAPVLEKAFAEQAGLGWIGKHTVLIHPQAGSWFFLGELITNLPLVMDSERVKNQCGDCQACLKICPTDAFVGPYELDASRCISYLTIELKGAIPEEFREPIGNRVFGCDDCQLICPWNKFAKPSQEKDFSPRHQLDNTTLLRLFLWSEEEYLRHTEGSAIRRIGYERWLRNLAIGLGNADPSAEIIQALEHRQSFPSALVQEHIHWALQRQRHPKRRVRKIKR